MLPSVKIKTMYVFILVNCVRSSFFFIALQVYRRGKYSKGKLTMRTWEFYKGSVVVSAGKYRKHLNPQI